MSTHPRITEFYFVRHGPVQKRQGHLPPYDPPLIDDDFDVTGLVESLPSNADWHISPLHRTKATANLLLPHLSPASSSFDERIIEMSFGDWHDKAVADIWAGLAAEPKHNWSFIMPDTHPANGESFSEQCDRISAWLDDMAAREFDKPQIIITHAGVIRAAMLHMMNMDPVHAIGIPIAHFGCLSATLMEPSRAIDAGGAWQFRGLSSR